MIDAKTAAYFVFRRVVENSTPIDEKLNYIQRKIFNGFDVNFAPSTGPYYNPLTLAIVDDRLEIAKLLIQSGAHLPTVEGFTGKIFMLDIISRSITTTDEMNKIAKDSYSEYLNNIKQMKIESNSIYDFTTGLVS